jgi:hypothetical protein
MLFGETALMELRLKSICKTQRQIVAPSVVGKTPPLLDGILSRLQKRNGQAFARLAATSLTRRRGGHRMSKSAHTIKTQLARLSADPSGG